MAEVTPPLYMDVNNTYSGDELGVPWRFVCSEGVVKAGDMAVSQRAAGANLSVDVAAGWAAILGDTNTDRQPLYWAFNDAVVNLGISPDPSDPRKVLVVAQATDEGFAGTGRKWELVAIHGTPAPVPAEPALPASALKLAVISVAAADTSIVNAEITNSRVRATVGGGSASVVIRKTTEKDVVSTAVETDMLNGEVTIAAGSMGTDKMIRLTLMGDYFNNTGADRTLQLRVKLGSTVSIDTPVRTIGATATRRSLVIEATIANLGANNVQRGSGLFRLGNDGSSPVYGGSPITAAGVEVYPMFGANGTEDTSLAKALQVTAIHSISDANLSCRLKYALIEIV